MSGGKWDHLNWRTRSRRQFRSSVDGELLTADNRGHTCRRCEFSEWAHVDGQCPRRAPGNHSTFLARI